MAVRRGLATQKKEFSYVFRLMSYLGWDEYCFGHCSFQLDSNSYLINEEQIPFEEVTEKSIIEIDKHGRSKGKKKAASFRLHSYLHRLNSTNKVILHTHYKNCIVMANSGQLQYASLYEGLLGDVCFEKHPKSGLDEQYFDKIGQRSPNAKIIFCEQHGVFVFGETISEAFYRLYLTCKAADVFVLSVSIQNSRPSKLNLSLPPKSKVDFFWKKICLKMDKIDKRNKV